MELLGHSPIRNCEFEPCSWRGVLDTTLYDKVCQWLSKGRWFSPRGLYNVAIHQLCFVMLEFNDHQLKTTTSHNVDEYIEQLHCFSGLVIKQWM
jgi:hypothetical protein